MKKAIFILGIVSILSLLIVMALDECGSSIPGDTRCSIISPYISSCSTFNVSIFYSNGSAAGGGLITQIGSTGIYNYSATFNASDIYILKLCDDSVRSLTVLNTSATSPSGSFWSYILHIYYNTLPGAW